MDPSAFSELDSFTLDMSHMEGKVGKLKKRSRLPSSWYFVENELENIIEEQDSYKDEEYSDESESPCLSEEEESVLEDHMQNYHENDQTSNKKSNEYSQLTHYEFHCPQWEVQNPQKELIAKLKSSITNSKHESFDAKRLQIKLVFDAYLCEHEKYSFENSLENLEEYDDTEDLIKILVKGINSSFQREIRGLSFLKRRLKILRYLDKKKRRIWKKKVSYDCRKKVADERLRIKGKFITHEQACERLGRQNVEGLTLNEIKTMLEKKIDLEEDLAL